MSISDICNKNVAMATPDTTILDAARLMHVNHVGDLIVVDNRLNVQIPIGIVTDRDIVMEIVAMELDAKVLTVGDIMEEELTTIEDSEEITVAIALMRKNGVRRMPVIDEHGGLVGILSMDDLINFIAEQLSDLATVVSRQRARESITRSASLE
jgi:predicted transcriptional regulator